MNKRWIALWAMGLAGCNCSSKSLGPLVEPAPSELAAQGFIVDQPAGDGAATGAWVTVSGWFDPEAVNRVAIVGAPVDGFYAANGHVGVPSVPVTLRADGRFFAPRVPLLDGATKITIIPFGKGGSSYLPVTRTLTVSQAAEVPATMVIDPAQPEPGKIAKLRAATADGARSTWQWDFEGDGTFDVESAAPEHAWPTAGRYPVIARTRVNGLWVCAYAEVSIGSLPDVVNSTTTVSAPSRLFVIPKYVRPPWPDGATAEMTATRFVAAIDGDEVKVFDGALTALFSLPGLSKPSHVAGDDSGRIYVADTGHDRIVRFLPDGTLDSAFGNGGAFSGSVEVPITRPIALVLDAAQAVVLLAGGLELSCGSQELNPMGGSALNDWTKVDCTSEKLSDSASFQALGLKALEHGVVRPSALFNASPTFERFVVQSKVISTSMGSFDRVTEVAEAIDVALGPTQFKDELAVVDKAGTLHLYRQGRKVASWHVGFPLTAIASGADGKLYLAGAGHLEVRAFAPLR